MDHGAGKREVSKLDFGHSERAQIRKRRQVRRQVPGVTRLHTKAREAVAQRGCRRQARHVRSARDRHMPKLWQTSEHVDQRGVDAYVATVESHEVLKWRDPRQAGRSLQPRQVAVRHQAPTERHALVVGVRLVEHKFLQRLKLH